MLHMPQRTANSLKAEEPSGNMGMVPSLEIRWIEPTSHGGDAKWIPAWPRDPIRRRRPAHFLLRIVKEKGCGARSAAADRVSLWGIDRTFQRLDTGRMKRGRRAFRALRRL